MIIVTELQIDILARFSEMFVFIDDILKVTKRNKEQRQNMTKVRKNSAP